MMEPRCWRIIWRPKNLVGAEGAVQVDIDHLVPLLVDTSTVGIFLCAPGSDHQDIHPAVGQHHLIAKALQAGAILHVRGHAQRARAEGFEVGGGGIHLGAIAAAAMVMAPAWTNPRAMASPIPLVPPRTTATRSFRENCSRAFMGVRLNIQRGNFGTEASVQFLTLQRDGWDEPGVLSGGEAIGLKGAGFDDLLQVIAGGPGAMDRVVAMAVQPRRAESASTRRRPACGRRFPSRPRLSASASTTATTPPKPG